MCHPLPPLPASSTLSVCPTQRKARKNYAKLSIFFFFCFPVSFIFLLLQSAPFFVSLPIPFATPTSITSTTSSSSWLTSCCASHLNEKLVNLIGTTRGSRTLLCSGLHFIYLLMMLRYTHTHTGNKHKLYIFVCSLCALLLSVYEGEKKKERDNKGSSKIIETVFHFHIQLSYWSVLCVAGHIGNFN